VNVTELGFRVSPWRYLSSNSCVIGSSLARSSAHSGSRDGDTLDHFALRYSSVGAEQDIAQDGLTAPACAVRCAAGDAITTGPHGHMQEVLCAPGSDLQEVLWQGWGAGAGCVGAGVACRAGRVPASVWVPVGGGWGEVGGPVWAGEQDRAFHRKTALTDVGGGGRPAEQDIPESYFPAPSGRAAGLFTAAASACLRPHRTHLRKGVRSVNRWKNERPRAANSEPFYRRSR
jgi:hypothetical protein